MNQRETIIVAERSLYQNGLNRETISC